MGRISAIQWCRWWNFYFHHTSTYSRWFVVIVTFPHISWLNTWSRKGVNWLELFKTTAIPQRRSKESFTPSNKSILCRTMDSRLSYWKGAIQRGKCFLSSQQLIQILWSSSKRRINVKRIKCNYAKISISGVAMGMMQHWDKSNSRTNADVGQSRYSLIWWICVWITGASYTTMKVRM